MTMTTVVICDLSGNCRARIPPKTKWVLSGGGGGFFRFIYFEMHSGDICMLSDENDNQCARKNTVLVSCTRQSAVHP